MSAEILPFERHDEVDAPPIPAEMVMAIAQAAAIAAVEAYKESERLRRNAEQRAYYRVNKDKIQARRRRKRSLR